MDFSDILNKIPIVGTIKGIVHYACGDTGAGDEAMYQSGRSTAIVAGTVVGGPVGAIGAAVAADATASAAKQIQKPF